VLQRYGARCAVCDVDVVEVLDAAHLCSKRNGGTDDPRNGLVLCATHHRALDAGLFAIDPDDLTVQCSPASPGTAALRLVRARIARAQRLERRCLTHAIF
jgi:predicted restriction endonuclease